MSNKKPTKVSIFIRADASLNIGIGHIMRTLGLASSAKDDGIKIYYLCYSLPSTLQEKIEKTATIFHLKNIKNENEVIDLAKIYNPFAIVLDSYSLDKKYELALKNKTASTIVAYEDLDNKHNKHNKHNSDIVINPNIYAKSSKSNHLYGAQWAIIRKEFKQKFHKNSNKFEIAITLGGSDEKNSTEQIIKALKTWHIPFFANIILGDTNPHKHRISKIIKDSNSFKLHKSPKNFASLLATADIIISASGQTTLEILYLKKPSIAITIASNQERISKALDENRFALTLDASELNNKNKFLRKLNRLYSHQRRYKKNSIEIAKHSILKEIKRTHLKEFTLLPFKQSDCDELFELTNDNEVRKASLNSNPITIEQHKRWCEKKIIDKTEIFIARSINGIFLGYVRFEENVSIALSKFARGVYFSKDILQRGLRQTSKKRVIAQIKANNFTSLSLFKSSGFIQTDKNADYVTMEYTNEN